ncbi:hypothetical protein [Shimia sediminis]|uniref:hypothetical protein n=1 Tax=Shimia sediminis TaxID=2497945 RepID=UPI000F8D8678|nr:hypothetical protein [Shimia sediminis]
MQFHHYQTLHDLRHAADFLLSHHTKQRGHRASTLAQALAEAINGRDPLAALPLTQDDVTYWEVIVWTPEADAQSRLTAHCVYLHDLLFKEQSNDLSLEWDGISDALNDAPNGVRSAIARGFALADPSLNIPLNSRVTQPRDQVILPLQDLARSMTPEMIDHVSKLDYGKEVKTHHKAIVDLLRSPDLRYPEGECWFPAEVIELASHTPELPAFVPCTAIVLINAFNDGDGDIHASFRWSIGRAIYRALVDDQKHPLLEAFRHLAESEPDWDPFFEHAHKRTITMDHLVDWQP